MIDLIKNIFNVEYPIEIIGVIFSLICSFIWIVICLIFFRKEESHYLFIMLLGGTFGVFLFVIPIIMIIICFGGPIYIMKLVRGK